MSRVLHLYHAMPIIMREYFCHLATRRREAYATAVPLISCYYMMRFIDDGHAMRETLMRLPR